MTQAVIDQTVLEELQDTMGADFAADLVTTFLEEAPGMLKELREAEAKGDTDGFRRAAHSLKSNATIFGAAALAEQARTLELEGNRPGAVTGLAAELDRTSAALQVFLDGN